MASNKLTSKIVPKSPSLSRFTKLFIKQTQTIFFWTWNELNVCIFSKENFWPVLLRVNVHWTNWYQFVTLSFSQTLLNIDLTKVLNQIFIHNLIVVSYQFLKIPYISRHSPTKNSQFSLKYQFFIWALTNSWLLMLCLQGWSVVYMAVTYFF